MEGEIGGYYDRGIIFGEKFMNYIGVYINVRIIYLWKGGKVLRLFRKKCGLRF